jgi:hypothetical protein
VRQGPASPTRKSPSEQQADQVGREGELRGSFPPRVLERPPRPHRPIALVTPDLGVHAHHSWIEDERSATDER